jgi:ABC-type multidrug transport system fused ATPase/permease subunit
MSLNVFEVFAKIGLDDSSLNKGLKGAGSAVAKIGKSLAKLGSIAVTAGTAMTTALVKSAVDSYAEYEQLVGGVDTLFKESSAKVQAYADEAYKTAGMSANQYMETVTSFSASLLQSLSGDTDKAADVANMALMDMSDNANKMGTAMENIQNAYQMVLRMMVRAPINLIVAMIAAFLISPDVAKVYLYAVIFLSIVAVIMMSKVTKYFTAAFRRLVIHK